MPEYRDKMRNTWLVKLSYTTWEGERKWLTKRGFFTKKEAAAWEAEFKYKTSKQLDMSLKSFSELYLANLQNRIKPDTLAMKTEIIKKWITPYLGKKQLNALTTEDVLMWQNKLLGYRNKKGNAFSKSYLKTIHNQLSALLNHGIRYYRLSSNSAAIVGNMGTDREVKVDYWTKEEYLQFADVMMERPMYYYFFEILYWCGLREGEALALTREDIDFANMKINVAKTFYVLNGKEYVTTPKTRNSIRQVVMPPFLSDELRDYFAMTQNPKNCQRIFPFTKGAANRELKCGAHTAGVKAIRVHDLRHSHVSLLINMGFPAVAIADRVGHSSIYITYHYAHMFPSVQSNMANELNKERTSSWEEHNNER